MLPFYIWREGDLCQSPHWVCSCFDFCFGQELCVAGNAAFNSSSGFAGKWPLQETVGCRSIKAIQQQQQRDTSLQPHFVCRLCHLNALPFYPSSISRLYIWFWAVNIMDEGIKEKSSEELARLREKGKDFNINLIVRQWRAGYKHPGLRERNPVRYYIAPFPSSWFNQLQLTWQEQTTPRTVCRDLQESIRKYIKTGRLDESTGKCFLLVVLAVAEKLTGCTDTLVHGLAWLQTQAGTWSLY